MEDILKLFMNKEDVKKVRLIKKYTKIRLKRFWNEWGISKEEAEIFLSLFSIFGCLFLLYILLYVLGWRKF